MESCEMCCGLRGHERLRDALFTELDVQYQKARDEYKLLQALFRDCCWYNFETACRSWQDPWHVSWEQSMISLDGMRVETDRNSLKITYPIWYRGVVRDAPPLPLPIIYTELKAAKSHMQQAEKARWAPYEFAPGGNEYEKLLRFGEGVRAFTELQSSKRGVA